MSWQAAVSIALLIAGAVLELIAVLGLCVMRNVYDRLHYVGVAGFGGFLIAVAVLVRESFSLIGDKALLVGIVLGARRPGAGPDDRSQLDNPRVRRLAGQDARGA